jgi:hypothetical protein
VGDDEFAVAPDPRAFAFDQEDIAGTTGEGVFNEGTDLGVHEGETKWGGAGEGKGKGGVSVKSVFRCFGVSVGLKVEGRRSKVGMHSDI